MASGSSSRAEGQPPTLPVKKHRSGSLSRSSLESGCDVLSPARLQHQVYNDVFSEATDCHAEQCPIHQRYDLSRHQERFFSDDTPPPVPKKKLARTLSLPGTTAPVLSALRPLSPLQNRPRDFDNPLYMLAPAPRHNPHEETDEVELATCSTASLLPFSQLTFDTPDEHLPYLFRGFDDQRIVSQGIQHRHLLFLRSMAESVEAEILLQTETSERDVRSHQPQDFLLCKGGEPKQIGDTVFYSLCSPRFPGKVLALKVHKQTDKAPSAQTKHQSSHVNVQDVIVHFRPNNNPREEPVTAANEDPASLFKTGCTAPVPPCRGSAESAKHPANNLPSLQALLLQGHSVSVERDLPQFTLQDFVCDSSSLQSTECLVYDRQVCVLLVQILTGLQHLYNIGATTADLRPQDILLVWPSRKNKLQEDISERRRCLEISRMKDGMEWEKTVEKGGLQMLWKTQGSPRVVLTSKFSPLSKPHTLPSITSQIGAIIQYCLHPQCPTLPKSLYRRGLLYLSSLFQGKNTGPQVPDMVATLQVLLWGPRVSLSNLRSYTATAVHNWLTIKRALLVMKLAEKGLIQDHSSLNWEECMCLQYLSFTDPETVVSVTTQLWLSLKMDRHL